ncbi:MAG: TfoX/Sxy family protein [Rhodobacterales bacterium]|nr:TfoX/Sxy family protein [Rhodobacterales bacterium]MDX5500587.1 TfoX/Sxy family protein [Rhodobacterales bacterium]
MTGTPLTSINSIGPATAASMQRAGIPDAETLRALGADAAYRKQLDHGEKPHFIWYYVLVMALQGRPWNDCKGAEKTALRARFDQIVAEAKAARLNRTDLLHPDLETALDMLGVVPRRG